MNEICSDSPQVPACNPADAVPSVVLGDPHSQVSVSNNSDNGRDVSDSATIRHDTIEQYSTVNMASSLTPKIPIIITQGQVKDADRTTTSGGVGGHCRNTLPVDTLRGATSLTKTGCKGKRGALGQTCPPKQNVVLPKAASGMPSMAPLIRPAVPVHDNVPMGVYIAKKRETGLVRLSLATKKAEIQRLETEMDRAEKKLRQQQDQLESTREKFNHFLKHSNLEQDAAVRRADDESKAKEEKIFEIKELCALIGSTEEKIKKMTMRLENCQLYKKFLDDLTKPRWFYDLLVKLRVEDGSQQILAEAESRFAQRAEAAIRDAERQAAQVIDEEEMTKIGAHGALAKEKNDGTSIALVSSSRAEAASNTAAAALTLPRSFDAAEKDMTAEKAVTGSSNTKNGAAHAFDTPVKLDDQFDMLHREVMQEAQSAVDTLARRVTDEVEEMSVEQVKEVIQKNYPDSRVPCYFSEVDQLLEVFINVEEGNLFLIQNCQELEEELENVTMDFMTEHEDMLMMTRQRHAQMAALAEKICVAKTKLEQLEERGAALGEAATTAPSTVNNNNNSGTDYQLSRSKKSKSDAASSQSNMSPEALKTFVEQSIAAIFRSLTAGDSHIKSLSSANTANPNPTNHAAASTHAATPHGQASLTKAHSSNARGTTHSEGGGGFDATGGAGGDGDYSKSGIEGRAHMDMDATGATATRSTAASKKLKLNHPSQGIRSNSHGNTKKCTTTSKDTTTARHAVEGRAWTQDDSGSAKNSAVSFEMSSGSHASGSPAPSVATGAKSGGDVMSSTGAATMSNETGANMSPIDMLTIIENKLEEYHRYIFRATGGVDDVVIRSVMKSKDKQRRHQARLEHVAQQAADQEERMQRALARAQAPVVKRQGKPVFLRSHFVKKEESRPSSLSVTNKMDDEGMEFFQ